ncbi:MAG TPA: dihydropteroate synthase [Aestuariivirgaceae bacterium]|nr:dihydropteroate synthase [Aestuariivirgaceae bacterium]
MTTTYLRPLGLAWGSDASLAVREGRAGRLAGGNAAFTSAELIWRDGRHIERTHQPYADLVRSSEAAVRRRLGALEAPRAAIAGLAMDAPQVMGIINVTPDSFSDGGETPDRSSAVALGRRLAEAGAAILDVGGESTRPGSEGVPEDVERSRVVPVIEALSGLGHKVSIDTRKPAIMEAATGAGAVMINDVSALRFDEGSRAAVARLKRPTVLMHAQGDPKTMQVNPTYDDVVLDVFDFLEAAVEEAVGAGLPRGLALVDPGIGFGKTFRQNLDVLGSLAIYHGLGVPLVVGASRKAFIGALTGHKTAKDRVSGSLAVAVAAVAQGAQILRVHDVRETLEAVKVWRAIMDPENSGI